jgi:hypothetical protein
MTPNAAPPTPASQPSKAANLPMSRPTDEQLQYDSEAEALVGNESDDDTIPHARSSTQSQPAAGNEAARWMGADKPCAPTQSNIDTAITARQIREI